MNYTLYNGEFYGSMNYISNRNTEKEKKKREFMLGVQSWEKNLYQVGGGRMCVSQDSREKP